MIRTARLPALLLTLGLLACGDKSEDDTSGGSGGDTDADTDGAVDCDPGVDADCDGVPDDEDCAPEDARTYPGATELPYDGVDNDCAGDGDLMDVDGDGYDGPVGVGPDCNDNNPEVHPGADEVCYNGIDENCDGEPIAGEDESPDCDGDGYDGYGVGAPDCDDADPAVNPGADEVWYDGADGDCSGHIDSDYDADYDGDDHADHGGTDCDDQDPLTYGTEEDGSTRAELLDGVDRNCDGDVDRITIFDASTAWYANTMSNDGLFGKGLAVGDDYDGDGHLDLVVGGPWSDSDDENCVQDGTTGSAVFCGGWVQVMLLDGTDGTPADVAHATYQGSSGDPASGDFGDWAGYDLANLGDQDGDGWAEIAVGHPLTGDIKVLQGAALQGGGSVTSGDVMVTATASGYMGFDVAALGDVDGDGKAELVGSISDTWANVGGGDLDVRVWSSQDMAGGGSLTGNGAMWQVDGASPGGEAIGSADLDGDGVAELAFGSNTASAGAVIIVSGADVALGGAVTVNDLDGLTGSSGSGMGMHSSFMDDVDGDGKPELVVSAPIVTTSLEGGGEVYVITADDAMAGGDASSAAMFTVQGSNLQGRLTVVGEHQGDIDADEVPDLVVSPLGGTALSSITGVAHVFYGDVIAAGGSATDTDGEAALPTRNADDQWGFSGVIFDYDADGDADLAMSAPFSNEVGMVGVFESGWVE
jgi:hypothetical protein